MWSSYDDCYDGVLLNNDSRTEVINHNGSACSDWLVGNETMEVTYIRTCSSRIAGPRTYNHHNLNLYGPFDLSLLSYSCVVGTMVPRGVLLNSN